MKAVLFPIALLASVAAAQTTTAGAATGTGSACAAENIVETCLDTENTQFNSCGTNDWDCKCAAYNAIVTCYNNCPNDPRQDSARGQQTIFCGYASQYPSSTTKVAGATKSASGSGSDATAATKTGSSGTGTNTASGAATSKTNAAASDLALNAGGVLAFVAGVVAAVL